MLLDHRGKLKLERAQAEISPRIKSWRGYFEEQNVLLCKTHKIAGDWLDPIFDH
jgi:hypothetical protein